MVGIARALGDIVTDTCDPAALIAEARAYVDLCYRGGYLPPAEMTTRLADALEKALRENQELKDLFDDGPERAE